DFDTYPHAQECLIGLTRSLETTVLRRLQIVQMDDTDFEVLVKSLPKTLIHLDLGDNRISKKSIPILQSCIISNGDNLKELILDNWLIRPDLQ
ncbi:unnamed protein product, partial [Rotaria magnacalcarata]